MKEPAGLESSVGVAERLSREICSFLTKVRSMLIRVRDTSIPVSLGDTMAGILEALAVKPDGEDPLVAAVRRQVTIGFESIFSLMMMHEVPFDAEKVTSTYPKDADGRDKSVKSYVVRARDLAARLTNFLAKRNDQRATARARRRGTSGAQSSKAPGSLA
jgi:hypothetical protein